MSLEYDACPQQRSGFRLNLKFSEKVINKLQDKHDVSIDEVYECFFNFDSNGKFLMDTREDHKTDPPTLWFVSMTDKGRVLKVCFIEESKVISIKTAYDANSEEIRIYEKFK